MRLLGISHCRICHARPWREKCQRNFTIMQCSPDPAGDEHIVFFVGWKRIFLEMESLMRLYRPFCGSDEWCKPQTTARRILAATKFPPPNFRGLLTSHMRCTALTLLIQTQAELVSIFYFPQISEYENWDPVLLHSFEVKNPRKFGGGNFGAASILLAVVCGLHHPSEPQKGL